MIMTTHLPIFSAEYSDKYEAHEQQIRSQAHSIGIRWKREYPLEEKNIRWGFYPEVTIPGPPSPTDTVASAHHAGEPEDEHRVMVGGYAFTDGAVTDSVVTTHSHATSSSPGPEMTTKTKPHRWISLWFAITIPVIFWDAGFCLMRPRSMVGGDLHWIWKPYALYQEIDYVYGVKALQDGDGFTNAQSVMNIFENFMNIAYLYLAHRAHSPFAPLLGFTSAVMTLWKTILYWAQEYYCNGCSVGHNPLSTLIIYWIIPNGLWLVVPSLIIWQLGKDISGTLYAAASPRSKTSSKKTQ